MGGKTGTTTQQVQIPQQVLQNYQLANNMMQSAATQPFQTYNAPQGNPNAFVAPINQQQQAGIDTTNMAANAAQPYFQAGTSSIMQGTQAGQGYNQAATGAYQGAYNQAQPYNQMATGLAMAGTGPVNAQQIGAGQINSFMSPYLNTVLGAQEALQNQQNQQQMSGQLGNAINQGAFGGDRAGLAAANLAQQQQIASQNVYANTLNQGYNQALGAAQQQQGVNLGAAQANRAALQQGASSLAGIGQQAYGQGTGLAQGLAGVGQQAYTQGVGTGTTLAGLGTQAQQNLLGAGQAQIGAGTLAQQTQQAGLSALYNQFLQQQGYPFQTAQAVANVAEGTGALSGSTTSTAQPMPFFSDKRLKEDIEPIGKTFDGQKIVKFRYKNEPGTRIGLIAQDVEKHHPDAVGLAGGYRTVDYDKATDAAAKRGHFRKGGLVPHSEGGAVTPLRAGQGYADGGSPSVISAADLAGILQAQAQALGLYGGAGRVPASGTGVGSMGYVPPPTGSVSHLVTAGAIPKLPESTMAQVMGAAGDVTKDYAGAREIYQDAFGKSKDAPPDTSSESQAPTSMTANEYLDENGNPTSPFYSGGLVRRHRAAGGTDDDPYKPVGPSIPGLAAAAQSDNAPAGLKTPGAPGQGAGGSGVLGAANSALGAYNTGKGLFDMAKDIGSIAALALAHGGSAYRHGYDDGGHVSDSGGVSSDSEVPTSIPGLTEAAKDTSDNKLSLPSPPPSSGGGGGGILGGASSLLGLGNALNTATEAGGFLSSTGALADAGSALLAFLSRGGSVNPHVHRALELASGGAARHGYATDGGVDDDPLIQAWADADNSPFTQAWSLKDSGNLAPQNNATSDPNWPKNISGGINSLGSSDDPTKFFHETGNALSNFWHAAQRGNPIGPQEQIVDTTPPGRRNTSGTVPGGVVPKNAAPITPPALTSDQQATLGSAGGDALTANMPNVFDQMQQLSRPGLGGGNPPPPISSDLAGSPAYQKGLAPEAAQPSASPAPAGPSDTGQGGDFMTRAGDWAERQLGINQGKPGTWMDRNESWLFPLLKGVGTMASSPSRYFGGALLQGVGAAAQAVPDLQTQQSQVALRQAQATGELAAAGRGGIVPVLHTLANGQTQLEYVDVTKLRGPLTKNQNGQYVMDDRVNPPIAAQYDYLGDVGKQSAANDADKFFMSARMDPGLLSMSNEKIKEVNNEAASGANNTRQLKKFAETMAGQTGPFEPGKLNPFMTNLGAWWDSIAPNLGLQGVKLDQLANSQEAEKLSRSIAASGEANADQRSFGALRAWMQMVSNAGMSRPAAMNLITKMYVDNQRAVDEGNYFNEYDKYNSANGGISGLYSGQNAESSFRRDYSDDRYMSEQAALANVLSDTGTMKMLENPDPKIRAAVIQSIEKKNPSLRNFGRYFSTAWSEGRQG